MTMTTTGTFKLALQMAVVLGGLTLGACSSFNQCMNPEEMSPVPGNVNATQSVN